MSERSTVPLTRCIRAVVRQVAESATDASLLSAFVRSRDPRAFKEIVRRHGPLVLSASRHILADPADADDACQATFVVLYRKAHTIRGGSLGGWLFHVARRAAIEVRRSAARRQFHEGQTARAESAAGPDLSWREACAILHDELDRLPAKYRLPLIACYLEGRTQDEAARELGWPAAVLRGRVDRGRMRLGHRLRLRGVTLSTGLLATATASVPANVTAAAVATPTSAVAAVVRSLVRSAGRAWSAAAAAVAVALVGGTVLVGGVFGRQDPKPQAPPPKELVAERPAPRTDAVGDPLPDGAIARLGTVRFSHGDGLKAILVSPDGKTVISVGNGKARVWDAESGRELRRFSTGTTDWDEQAVLSGDGKRLVLLLQRFQGDPVREFDVETGKSLRERTLPVKRNEMSIDRRNALAPDGRLCALHTPDRVHVFDAETGKELYSLPKKGRDVKSIAFAGPDQLVTADAAKLIEVWDARTGTPIRSFDHGAPAGVIAATPDGKLLATLGHHVNAVDEFLERDVVRVWDLSTGKLRHELAARPGRWFMRVGFSPDGKTVHAFSLGRTVNEVTIWDAQSGKVVREIADSEAQTSTISRDGRTFFAGGEALGKFEAWDLATGKPIHPTDAPRPWAGAVHLSPNGDKIVTLSNAKLTQWDTATGRVLGSVAVPPHTAENQWSTFSRDGRFAVLMQHGEKTGSLTVWDVSAGIAAFTIPLAEQHGVTTAFSPDLTRIAIRVPGNKQMTVSVRDLKTGKEVAALRLPPNDWPGLMFFRPDGESLIVSGKRTVAYRLSDGKELFAWTMAPQPSSSGGKMAIGGPGGFVQEDDRVAWRVFVVSPDGALAACVLCGGWGFDAKLPDRIALCDAQTGKILRRWSDSGKQSRGYEVVTFSADGRLLATSDGDDVHLWEVATGKEIRHFRGHRNEVHALGFSANGRRLASSSLDSTVLIWDLSAPGAADPATCWADLLSDDAAKAYAAVWRLADAGDEAAVGLLRKQLRPIAAADQQKMRKAIAELNSDEFRIREKAFKDLADLGYGAGPALRGAQEQTSSAEARNRIDQLLAKLVGPPSAGESLRTWRALAALESMGTPGAKELLRELAAGAEDAWLTREAKASLRRVEGR